jgi:UDP-N-acetylglucosamine 2-epimerase
MIGNSSSGLIEAPSFGLPVVNVGDRQRGRLRAANVIDVGHDREAIAEAIRRALDPSFRGGLAGLVNPYGDGQAAPRIARVLREVELGPRLVRKRFADALR